jgi:hypothetical protein
MPMKSTRLPRRLVSLNLLLMETKNAADECRRRLLLTFKLAQRLSCLGEILLSKSLDVLVSDVDHFAVVEVVAIDDFSI